MAETVTTAAAVFSALSSAKQLFTKAPKAPKVEEPAPVVPAPATPAADKNLPPTNTPTVMPTEDSQLVADARRRALIAQATRGGRASTVLTDSEKFGGN